MDQGYGKSKIGLPPTADDQESVISVGYDLALSSLLNMLDEIDPLSASEMRARLGIEEEGSDSSAPPTSRWQHPTFS
ncbi:MAG: hypothetical protein V7746_15550 [Halioglobus sp.]